MEDLITRITISMSPEDHHHYLQAIIARTKLRGRHGMERVGSGDGFSVSDGLALVMGSAIASVHILGVRRWDLSAPGWFMVGLTFAWVAVTAAGPFVFMARRYGRRLPDYPQIGDRLWALLGIPWLVTALLQSASQGSEPQHGPLFTVSLTIGLAIVCLIALGVVWSTWVMVSPQQAARLEAAPWTNRVGLILSIAWPIQCGLGMIVLS
jgi:hypothetical protein